MEINRRALYNSLRMNWILDPTLEVETWQVEDYRAMHIDTLFEKLEDQGIHLTKSTFLSFAEPVDSPEELTDILLADSTKDAKLQDQIYLLIFELWRRLLPEKPCLSVFCDEIDHQIYLYDRSQAENSEAIQDAVANLQVILDENTDQGADSQEVFQCLNEGCANDLESFLYDYIAEQIDHEDYSYANELLEGFDNYVGNSQWFEFLHVRLAAATTPEEADLFAKKIAENTLEPTDLPLYMEILSFLVSTGEKNTFEKLAKKTSDLLEVEEDFQNLVAIAADFYHRLDHDHEEQALQEILNKRSQNDLTVPFKRQDPHLVEFINILSKEN